VFSQTLFPKTAAALREKPLVFILAIKQSFEGVQGNLFLKVFQKI
jgi:hypothetical protein